MNVKLTNNDEYDRWLLTETAVVPNEPPSFVAYTMRRVLEDVCQRDEQKFALVFQLMEQAFDAGRITGQLDILDTDEGRLFRRALAN
jgi:hypothetical protein